MRFARDMTPKYFYDSYAIVAYINGNDGYKKYFIKESGVTTLYNVMEVYYAVLREEDVEKARKVLHFLKPIVIYPSLDDVEPSMNFRLKHKGKSFSYADCLGYILAQKLHIKFLTGDKAFNGFQGVEFVRE